MAWASFPCQDLSLAGNGAGLKGKRSGIFWEFWRLIHGLNSENRAPRTVVLENVSGAITSHKGKDMAAISGNALAGEGYRFAPIVVDASYFLPQSRPRLFIIAVHQDLYPPADLLCLGPQMPWHPENFGIPYDLLNDDARSAWLWAHLPIPAPQVPSIGRYHRRRAFGVAWHSAFETRRLLEMMTPIQSRKGQGSKAHGPKNDRHNLPAYTTKRQRCQSPACGSTV